MSIEARMPFSGAIKRITGTVTSDGAGNYIHAPTVVASARAYHRWLPSAYTRTMLRTELGLSDDATVWQASLAYDAAADVFNGDWIVEAGSGNVFRITGLSARYGIGNRVHHLSCVLIDLNSVEPTA